jgi:hypothetical protein
MNLVVIFAITIIIISAAATSQRKQDIMTNPVRQIAKCKCGKVELSINSPSALRLVCYSKDYRGYYNTLNEQAKAKSNTPNAALDPWGGVDLTQIYVSGWHAM